MSIRPQQVWERANGLTNIERVLSIGAANTAFEKSRLAEVYQTIHKKPASAAEAEVGADVVEKDLVEFHAAVAGGMRGSPVSSWAVVLPPPAVDRITGSFLVDAFEAYRVADPDVQVGLRSMTRLCLAHMAEKDNSPDALDAGEAALLLTEAMFKVQDGTIKDRSCAPNLFAALMEQASVMEEQYPQMKGLLEATSALRPFFDLQKPGYTAPRSPALLHGLVVPPFPPEEDPFVVLSTLAVEFAVFSRADKHESRMPVRPSHKHDGLKLLRKIANGVRVAATTEKDKYNTVLAETVLAIYDMISYQTAKMPSAVVQGKADELRSLLDRRSKEASPEERSRMAQLLSAFNRATELALASM